MFYGLNKDDDFRAETLQSHSLQSQAHFQVNANIFNDSLDYEVEI